jgi:zinc transporter 13
MDVPLSAVSCSAIGSLLVGLTGIFPLLFINQEYAESRWMKYILAFGAGTLLGDAFLHLLPEVLGKSSEWPFGVLFGYVFGFVVQKCLPEEDPAKSGAYVNLMANCMDNFTHGLAIAGAFVVDRNMGIRTTMGILLHEIPHELGDFAILLRGGLTRSKAAVLQLITACAGLMGAMFVIFLEDTNPTIVISVIVPFTVGAFMYVALTNVIPEITKETSEYHFVILHICLGCIVMGFLSH